MEVGPTTSQLPNFSVRPPILWPPYEISLDLAGEVMQVMTSRHSTSSENDSCYCDSPAKYSSYIHLPT
jgi:hypothetical protein